MLTNEFSQIKGCQVDEKKNSGFWSGIKDFFTSLGSRKSVEQVCRGQDVEKVN
jgi:hypothetical protein